MTEDVVYIPSVYYEMTSQKMITMDWVDGIKLVIFPTEDVQNIHTIHLCHSSWIVIFIETPMDTPWDQITQRTFCNWTISKCLWVPNQHSGRFTLGIVDNTDDKPIIFWFCPSSCYKHWLRGHLTIPYIVHYRFKWFQIQFDNFTICRNGKYPSAPRK